MMVKCSLMIVIIEKLHRLQLPPPRISKEGQKKEKGKGKEKRERKNGGKGGGLSSLVISYEWFNLRNYPPKLFLKD